ncbi:MAG: hypothetical protein WBM98_01365 [Maribacter sp.]|uniref:hypothetical protein n=1 Tax=Maribacter sp. TaxID=1897614 RepID=UPI003C78B2FC
MGRVFGYGPAKAEDGSHGGQSSKIEYTAEDIRFTVAKDKKAMYVFFLGKPEAGELIEIRTIGGYHRNIPPAPIKKVNVLGSNVAVNWELTAESFYLTIPVNGMNEIATVFKFELE